MMPQILNLRDFLHVPEGAAVNWVRIDRSSPWGNPFIMHGENTRDLVCEQFEQYAHWRLSIEPKWLDPIRGKNLACWCAPKRCHAETLMRLANRESQE